MGAGLGGGRAAALAATADVDRRCPLPHACQVAVPPGLKPRGRVTDQQWACPRAGAALGLMAGSARQVVCSAVQGAALRCVISEGGKCTTHVQCWAGGGQCVHQSLGRDRQACRAAAAAARLLCRRRLEGSLHRRHPQGSVEEAEAAEEGERAQRKQRAQGRRSRQEGHRDCVGGKGGRWEVKSAGGRLGRQVPTPARQGAGKQRRLCLSSLVNA